MRPRPRSEFVELDLLEEPATRAALILLLGGYRCAELLRRPKWEFACDLDRLRGLGLTDGILQALVGRSYLEQRAASDLLRIFGDLESRTEGPCLSPAPHFMLTSAGAALACQLVDGKKPDEEEPGSVPLWEPANGELRYKKSLVKRLRRIAPNQECLLSTFQELGWPKRIDDPISPEAGIDRHERLRDTVRHLNKGLQKRVLSFRMESDGRGVLWVGK